MVPLVVVFPVGTGRPEAMVEETRVVVGRGATTVEVVVLETVEVTSSSSSSSSSSAGGVTGVSVAVAVGVVTAEVGAAVGAGVTTVEVMDGIVISTPASLQI